MNDNSRHTVRVGKGLLWIVVVVLILTLSTVSLYFWNYGLPPPIGEEKVEIKEVVKEVIKEAVVPKSKPSAEEELSIKSLRYMEDVLDGTREEVPFDVAFDAEIIGIEVIEKDWEEKYTAHLKLRRQSSDNPDDKFTGRDISLIVSGLGENGIHTLKSLLKWGKIKICHSTDFDTEPELLTVVYDSNKRIRRLNMKTISPIVPYKYIEKDQINKILSN